jgi:selenocysteine lyase/cysteine desulfurase
MRYHEAYAGGGLGALLEGFAAHGGMVRSGLGRLLGVSPDTVAITHNTAEGINIVAHGFPFSPGDRILTTDREYSANVLPWLAQQKRGVWVDFVAEHNGRLPVEAFAERLTPQTRIVAVSFVSWCAGYRLDLAALGRLCRDHGAHLVVDAAQGLGALDLDAAACHIAALACPTWKWLWGPLGLGFFYMEPSFMEIIEPVFVGAEGVMNHADPLVYDPTPRAGMRRFEYSTMNYADIVQFSACLDLTHEIGIGVIAAHVLDLAEAFRSAVTDCGGTVYGDFTPAERSGIFSFTHPLQTPEGIARALGGQGILVRVRDNRVRVSPHAYLDDTDVARFRDTLAETVRA